MGIKIAYVCLTVSLWWQSGYCSTTTSIELVAALRYTWFECGETICRQETQVCRENSYCECRPHFEDQGSQTCLPCPGEGLLCDGCCISDALTCYRGVCQRCAVDSNGNCINQETLFFLTAAQVALATAMVLGVISLSFLLYRTLRNRLRRNNPTVQSESRQSVASRVSLSSIQQRVVRRLRDRPPKYETRHNYEYQQRQNERQSIQHQQNQPLDVVGHDIVPVTGPPPAYEGDVVSLAENPPPYTQDQTGGPADRIAVIDIPLTENRDNPLPAIEANNADTRGFPASTSQGYEPALKQEPTMQFVQTNGSNNGCQKECIDIPLVNSEDKTVYM